MRYSLLFLDEFGNWVSDTRLEMNVYIRFFVYVNAVNEIYIKYGNDFVMNQIDDIRKVIYSFYFSDFKDFLLKKSVGCSCKLVLSKEDFCL